MIKYWFKIVAEFPDDIHIKDVYNIAKEILGEIELWGERSGEYWFQIVAKFPDDMRTTDVYNIAKEMFGEIADWGFQNEKKGDIMNHENAKEIVIEYLNKKSKKEIIEIFIENSSKNKLIEMAKLIRLK